MAGLVASIQPADNGAMLELTTAAAGTLRDCHWLLEVLRQADVSASARRAGEGGGRRGVPCRRAGSGTTATTSNGPSLRLHTTLGACAGLSAPWEVP